MNIFWQYTLFVEIKESTWAGSRLEKIPNRVKMEGAMSEILPSKRPALPPPNPVTQRAHRRQILRQVTLPLLFVVALAVTGIWIATTQQIGGVARWAEISAIFVILPLLIVTLIPLVLAVVVIYGIQQVLKSLPPYTRKTQLAIERIQRQIKSGADISIKPILQIQGFLAVITSLIGKRN